ncbi:MAG: hypothetical protein M1832_000345 [Thelocarpon impressellum]|nr:MAG: hypothetical protein M1832_000345 [Thelocarpon impressellum]
MATLRPRFPLFLRPGCALCPPCRAPSRRPLSAQPRLSARGEMAPAAGREKQQKATAVAMKDIDELPSDLGMLDRTFVMPLPCNRPSLLARPADRLKLEWVRLKSRVRDLGSLLIYKTLTRPRQKLLLRKTAPVAVALHHRMFSSFADGDVDTLREICAAGLFQSFSARLVERGRDRVSWQLHRYTGRAQVMSDRAAKLPRDRCGLRQAVVRVRSRQSLTRRRPDGAVAAGTGRERECVEYVVVQRRLWDGVESPWIVWGTTGETSLEDVREVERREEVPF